MSTSIEAFRGFYARRIAAMAGTPAVEDRLVRAFEAVPREQFLEKGPWNVFTGAGYIKTPTDDPAFLYQDVVVALSGEGPANNGQPSLHAMCLGNVNPTPGETVLHIGAGSGYYTAILAMLVGPTGTVVAYEIQKSLAEWAAGNLAAYSNVTVRNRSGSAGPLPYADVVYVSAGATAPLGIWLDALQLGRAADVSADGGRRRRRDAAHHAKISRPFRRGVRLAGDVHSVQRRSRRSDRPEAERGVPARRYGSGELALSHEAGGRQLLVCGRRMVAVDLLSEPQLGAEFPHQQRHVHAELE